MGRPIKKSNFGSATNGGSGNIEIYSYRFSGETEVLSSSTPAWIVRQKSSKKFVVSDGTTTQVLKIGGTQGSLAEGEMALQGYDSDGDRNDIVKIYNRVAQVIDDGAQVKKQWKIGSGTTADDANDLIIPGT